MPTYKLYYFPGRGRAELTRWIFTQAGVPYEDIRKGGEDWAAFKPSTPFEAMPVLEIDGKLYAGSGPMARHIAETHGLAGSNELENLELASLFDLLEDLYLRLMLFRFEKEDARKAELKKELEEKHYPKFLRLLNKRIVDNGSPEGWIYGRKVTYIDLYAALLCEFVTRFSGANALDAYPALAKLKETVEALPKIAKWIKERPVTEF